MNHETTTVGDDVAVSGWICLTDAVSAAFIIMLVLVFAAASQLEFSAKIVASDEEMRRRVEELASERDRAVAEISTKEAGLAAIRAQNSALVTMLRNRETELKIAIADAGKIRSNLIERQAELTKAKAAVVELQTEVIRRETELASARENAKKLDIDLKRAKTMLEANEENRTATPSDASMLKTDNIRLRKLVDESAANAKASEARARLTEAKARQYDDFAAAVGLTPEEVIRKMDDTKLTTQAQHRALLGLKGDLGRVAIVLDFSGSMNEIIAGATDSRWTHTLGIIETWLTHLNMNECVLILYSEEVELFFPKNESGKESYALKTSETDEQNIDATGLQMLAFVKPFPIAKESGRKAMLDLFKRLKTERKPDGGTNTLKALRTALAIKDIGTVILFTDGMPGIDYPEKEPERDGVTTSDRKILRKPKDFKVQMDAVFKLCDYSNRSVPINTVGVGDYFHQELSEFLIKVADKTGGQFLGR